MLVFHLNPAGFPPGWTGVDLFFVLSGYLITQIIIKHETTKQFFRAFYIRRGLRIWPIYYLCFVGLIAVNRWLPRPYTLDGWPFYATYTQNVPSYWGKQTPPFNPAFDHTWTLALEEQYYLVWPAVVMFAGPRRLVALCIGVITLAFVCRSGFQSYFIIPIVFPPMSERLLVARCDGFALGGLLAALLPGGRPSPRARGVIWLGLAVSGAYLAWMFGRGGMGALGLPTPSNPALTILMVDLFYFGVVGAVLLNQGHRALAPLRWKPLCHMGLISYGIYMYHYIVYWIMDGCGGGRDDFIYQQPWTIQAAKVVLTILVAMASWRWIERPILSLKDRFRYALGPQPDGEAGVPSVSGKT